MKRIISLILAALIAVSVCVSFTSCKSKDEKADKIRIGYMAGPTGMGMAKLIHDNGGETGNSKYEFKKYADTQAAKADLAAGKIDLVCLPTNEAAMYYNTHGEDIQALSINCLNSLYLLTDKSTSITSFGELEGETIYTCKNGTPRQVLEYILEANNINATVSYTFGEKEIVTPQDLAPLVITGKLPIVVAPEPVVTSALLKISANGNADIEYSVDLNLQDGWSSVEYTPITMGCIVGRESFVKTNKEMIDSFLDEYEDSIEFISKPENREKAADYIVEAGVMEKAPAAKKALTNLADSISYIDGDDMERALKAFYTAIGVKVPTKSFYYDD